MSGPFIYSRRNFLRQAGAFSALSLAASLDKIGLSSAAAQSPGYKALVCVFLFGGNDSNHMVLPVTDYNGYLAVRPTGGPTNIPLTVLNTASNLISPPGGKQYALHPNFTATGSNPTLTQLFNQGRLAVVANTGTLVEPLANVTEYRSAAKKKPANLFSHNDQQQQAMTSITQASAITSITGWAGRLGDKVMSMNPATATPMSMSFSGTQSFGNGNSIRTLALPTGGTFGFSGDAATNPTAQQVARASARGMMIQAWDANDMIRAAQGNMSVALNASQKLNPIIAQVAPYPGVPASITNAFGALNTGLANQLRAVAKMIDQRVTLQHSRQIFFVSIGGFDTHSGQQAYYPAGQTPAGLPSLYQQIGQALSAFYQATVNMGVAANVTTFTMTDFSRTFRENGSGTDHAWGGHHFVLGGSVVGNNLYGAFPSLALNGPDSTDTSGRWIPSTSMDQFGATLAKWFGASPVDVAQIFPNLYRFPSGDLGFMG